MEIEDFESIPGQGLAANVSNLEVVPVPAIFHHANCLPSFCSFLNLFVAPMQDVCGHLSGYWFVSGLTKIVSLKRGFVG